MGNVELSAARSSIAELQAHSEAWRHRDVVNVSTQALPHMIPIVQAALRELVPANHAADCSAVRNVRVDSVQAVMNMRLWKRYEAARSELALILKDRFHCPWIREIVPAVGKLNDIFYHLNLESKANETLPLHGTEEENVDQTLHQGLDDRLGRR